jgi:pimeloyl-ACP methyl ester carboxylesterase/DNA-binding winged helix-turn-helix (wHTH) protein
MIWVFGDCEVDTERYEFKRAGRVRPLEPQVFDLLLLLLSHRERVVTKDELFGTIWKGKVVSDATLGSRVNALRRAVGDSGVEQKVIRTVPRRGFRFVAEVSGIPGSDAGALPEVAGAGTDEATSSAHFTGPGDASSLTPAVGDTEIRQDIQIHTTADGVSLAYSSIGAGPPLVKAANWMNHLEFEIHNPPWQHWWHALSRHNELFRYDQRGNGLSDWDAEDISFEAFVRDLESVIESTGHERFALLGISQGCAISVAYAARHPQRVSHLILYGGYVKGWRLRGDPEEIKRGEAFMTLMAQGWGQDNSAYRQLFTSMFMPDGTVEQMKSFNELERLSASPRNATRLLSAFGDFDVSALLPKVSAPTLVLHCRNDARAPFEQGRAVAAGIRNARFVPLEGRNHIMLPDEPAWIYRLILAA